MLTKCPKVYPRLEVSVTAMLAGETSLFNSQTPFSMLW